MRQYGPARMLIRLVMAVMCLLCLTAANVTPPVSSVSTAFLATLTEQERVWLQAHPVISVAQDPGWPPIEFLDRSGNPSGMTKDYLTLIEHRLGRKFEPVLHLSWQEAYARMKRGEIDMTTTVAETPERLEFWAFTKPYMNIPIVIATQQDVTYIGNLRELAGKKVAAVEGYAVHEWIKKDFPEVPLIKVKTSLEGLQRLQRGELDAFIDSSVTIGHHQANRDVLNVKIAGATPYFNAQRMAVRKDWAPFAGILQKALDSISVAEREEIFRRWLPIRYEHGFDYTLLWQVLAGFSVILLGLGLWNHRLMSEMRLRKQAEMARSLIEQRFSDLVSSTDGIVWEADATTFDFVLISPNAERMLGYQTADWLQPGFWASHIHPEDRDQAVQYCAACTGRAEDHDFEYRFMAADGRVVWLRDIVRVATENGHPRWLRGLMVDITAHKQAEQELQVLLREKTALLLEVHHRVKNNLQVITSLLRLERFRSKDAPAKAVLQDMQDRVRSMALLHETIYHKGTFAAIDLGSYVGQIAGESLKSMQVNPGTVRLQLDMETLQVGLDQATPAGMLVSELVSNCLKHAFPEGRTGEIGISLHPLPEPGQWRLRVSDSGIGLAPDFEDRRKTSLGLQLAGDMATQMGGTLHIGAGPQAVFTVDFKSEVPAPLVINLDGAKP